MAEECMRDELEFSREHRERIKSLVLHSLQQDPQAWQKCGAITWYHEGMGLSVYAGETSYVSIWDRDTVVQKLADGIKSSRFRLLFRKPTTIDQIWNILHSWRHAEVEARVIDFMARFEQKRTAPEVSRLKELVDATRS